VLFRSPTLTAAEVRELLTSAASRDGYTGTVPNVRWGFGKLDAWAALQNVGTVEPPPGGAAAVSVEHNPAIDEAIFDYTVPDGTAAAELRVYDVTGRRVFETLLALSASAITWNLTGSDGERIAAGLYLYVLVTDRGNSEVKRLVVAP
jgi:hypothetical protein